MCFYEIGMELLCRIEVGGLTVLPRVHDKIPSLEKGKHWSPYCSDAWKPTCSHTSQSKLKDFLFPFFVWGFIEGARGGKGFFSVLYKNKVYSCFILYSDCKRYWRVPLDSSRGCRWRRLWQVLWLGHVLFRNKNPKKPFFSIPRQAAISWLTNTLQCTSLQMIFSLFLRDTAVPTHREFLICKLEVCTMPYRA